MKVYDVEIIVEHRYIVKTSGDDYIEAGNKALEYITGNEDKMQEEDLDFHITSVKEK